MEAFGAFSKDSSDSYLTRHSSASNGDKARWRKAANHEDSTCGVLAKILIPVHESAMQVEECRICDGQEPRWFSANAPPITLPDANTVGLAADG